MKFDTRTIEEVTERLIDYRGKTPPKVDSGVKLITAKIIKDGFIQNSNFEYISEETYETWMRRGFPKKGDILITTEAPLGEVAQVRTPEKIALAQRIILLRGNPQVIDQQYYFQVLKSTFVQAGLQMRGTGTTVLGIRQNELRQVEIPYYSLPTQRKIAAILGAYDDLIENNTRRIKILEEMAQTIYREWFVEFRFPGHEKVKMVESELGLIPEGWQIVKLSDIVELTRTGVTPSKFPKEIFAHFSIPAFDSGRLPTLDSGETIKSSKCVVPSDCVLMSKLNPHIPRVWLPFINTVHRPIASTEFLIIKPKTQVDCVYLFHLFQSPEFSREFSVQRLGTSHSHQRVSPEGFLGMSILLPNESLLNEFRAKVSPMVDLCNALRLKNANLRKTRDLLLPKLISGELDVSDLDISTDGIQPRKGGTHIPHPLTEWLHSDEKILAGKPVIKGTRLSAEFIVDLLDHDWNEGKILENYPGITREEINACRAYQKKVTNASASG